MTKPLKRVVVSGGGGQIAYNALFRIASGEMLGADQPIELHILEIPEAQAVLDGVIMELEDCAYPLLKSVKGYVNPYEAFKGCDIALLIGAKPRGPGMERKDLLSENAKIFIEQGKALNDGANKGALVFVVGNPCNTNALITLHHAPKIDKQRIFAMTRLDENRAKAQLAKKANVAVEQIKRMTIWGNHSSTQVPDFLHAQIDHQVLTNVITDRKWLENEFVSLVQKRGAQVIGARGKSSAASAAHAIIGSIQALMKPTPNGDWFSMGLYTEGNPYGIQSNLIFSFPCRSLGGGRIEVIANLEWDAFLKEKIRLSEEELIEERKEIQTLL